MWQRLQLSHIPRHKHIEHDRLTDACTGCGDAYNSKVHIVHHVCKHHVTDEEHERLTITCTGCGAVYNTKDYILHHMCKHHITDF